MSLLPFKAFKKTVQILSAAKVARHPRHCPACDSTHVVMRMTYTLVHLYRLQWDQKLLLNCRLFLHEIVWRAFRRLKKSESLILQENNERYHWTLLVRWKSRWPLIGAGRTTEHLCFVWSCTWLFSMKEINALNLLSVHVDVSHSQAHRN